MMQSLKTTALSQKIKSVIIASSLALSFSAFADNSETINAVGQFASAMGAQGGANSGTYNQIGQIANAMNGQQNVGATNSSSNLGQAAQYANALGIGAGSTANTPQTTPPVLYSDNELKAMDCMNLELASTRQNNAITQTKNNATDLLAAEKEAAGQQKSKASAAADIGAMLLAQRGGKTGEYAKMYQGMQGDPNATSNALDIEIKNLSKMNEQASEIKIYQKYKNCPDTAVAAPPVIQTAPVAVTPAVAASTSTTTKSTAAKKKTKKKVVKKTTN